MNDQTIVLMIAIAVVVLLATAIAWLVVRNRRTETLAVEALGSRSTAEANLFKRMKRVQHLEIRALSPEDRDRFAHRWRRTQASFVDNPVGALADADALVEEVMHAQGYPVSDFERRTADISVEHPRLVRNYRDAHAVAVSARQGSVRTEDLKRAALYFRDLFDDLLERATGRTAHAQR